MEYYPITGIDAGIGSLGEVPQRLEIDSWWFSDDPVHTDQTSLFIAALKRFQAIPINEKESYFQVAGIHSEPLLPWDEGNAPLERRNTEYCHHSENTFPTWHRPYILLFEQRIYEIMIREIIPEFEADLQSRLNRAADLWRLPYWDWASKKPVYDSEPQRFDYNVPELVRLETVKIRVPKKNSANGYKWVRNPLHSFRLPGDARMSAGGVQRVWKGRKYDRNDPNSYLYFDEVKGTSRYPPTNRYVTNESSQFAVTFIEGYQDHDSLMRRLRDTSLRGGGSLTASLRENFLRVANIANYEDFSTKRRLPQTSVPGWGSIESIHDNMHVWCGGGYFGEPAFGHMSWVPVAAFDPIFWLHHNNVDRLFAIWQALHPKDASPNHWFKNPQDAQEALKPFRYNLEGKYWNSDMTYETARWGYTFDDLPKRKITRAGKTEYVLDKSTDDIGRELNQKYGATRRAEQKAVASQVQAEPVKLEKAVVSAGETASKIRAQLPDGGSEQDTEPQDLLAVNDYVVSVKYERFALGGQPFAVLFCIGAAPNNDDSSDSITTKSIVGEVYNFVAPSLKDKESGCSNCKAQEEEGVEVTGQVVLTNALLTRYKQQVIHSNASNSNQVLESIEPEAVKDFLRNNLHWRIVGMDGNIVPKEQVPSLKVAVAVGKADHFADPARLSIYRDYKVLYDVTAGRDGGASPEDGLFPPQAAY